MKKYQCLTQQEFSEGDFKLVPIRFKDRYEIMKWRNEQIYHLRQKEPITIEQQDAYFENVVAKLFDQEQPNQVLFSFLKKGELIGYGGLVHINWADKNAEVSFMTKDPKQFELWSIYLEVLKTIAFEDLQLNNHYNYINVSLLQNIMISDFSKSYLTICEIPPLLIHFFCSSKILSIKILTILLSIITFLLFSFDKNEIFIIPD